MGWLFGKRKEPRVPLPEAHEVDDSSLRFPSSSSKRVIEPRKIKEAVGFEKPLAPPEMPMEFEPVIEKPRMPPPLPKVRPARPTFAELPTITPVDRDFRDIPSLPVPVQVHQGGEHFVKVETYQHLLGKLESVHSNIVELDHISKKLERSEYHEEENFDKMKKAVRSLHDKLLRVDKLLFKG
ncbi:MAG: hypothetical protein Q8Q01_02810 [archaeon]|nr:hypothetical protein [archaeon]